MICIIRMKPWPETQTHEIPTLIANLSTAADGHFDHFSLGDRYNLVL